MTSVLFKMADINAGSFKVKLNLSERWHTKHAFVDRIGQGTVVHHSAVPCDVKQ